MNDSCSYILGAVRRYVLDYASDGYSASGAKAFARLLGGELPPPLAALFDTLECTAAERMAAVLGLAAAVDAQTAAALRAQFGTPDGVLTPQILCALILGTSYPADGGLGLIGGVTARIFDGVSPACGARMTLKPLIRDFLLYGTAGEGWLTRLSPEGEAPDDYAASAADAAAEAMSACGGDIPSVIHIIGVPGSGRRTVLRAAAARRGLHFALIRPCAAASADPAGLAVLLALMGTWPAIPADGMTGDADFRTLLHALLAEIGTVAVLSEEAMSADTADADYIAVPVPLPSVAAQSAIWQRKSAAYPVADGVDFREIAMEFRLPPGAIDRAFRFAAMQSRGAALTAADIKRGCYNSVGSFMGGRAVRVSCAFSWDDLVLPAHSKKLLRIACDYVRCGCTVYEKWNFGRALPYGRGVSMIFTGPPGTGKTMAAQVMAHELGLELYKVNLAAVVSKYIGETEKNLNDIFVRAERSRVVLFFDEADVLFGKRTEVKDSNDKYSNMEAAFLLQKIEEYSGIAVLATNFVQNFDEAFKRRMKFLVEFPFPGRSEREELWHKVFPPEAPLGAVDYDYLVENFELSGSNIKNIAVHSAFLAAAGGAEKIDMRHIVAALKNEFAKSGKAFTRTEAGEYAAYLDD